MESIYFLVPDNASEIISICYNTMITFFISSISKLFSSCIYCIPKLTLHFHHDENNYDKYWKLKHITIECLYIGHGMAAGLYFTNFTRMSTINSLYILNSPKNYSKIYLTHFTNLTCLRFSSYECEEIVYNYARLKKIYGLHSRHNNISVFDYCTNIEYLHFDFFKDSIFFDNENIYPKLTHLFVGFYSEKIQTFHLNYFHNIVELGLARGYVDFEKYKFPTLTSLSLLHLKQSQRLKNMFLLKSLMVSVSTGSNVNIYLSDTLSLKNLTMDGFQRLLFVPKQLPYIQCVYFHAYISSLEIIEINTSDNVYFNCDQETVENLRSLKYIAIAKKTLENFTCFTYLKQDLFDMIRIDKMKSNIKIDC